MLFEVTGPKGKAYLFGTVHVGKPEFYPLDETTTHAVASSKYLAVEADVLDQERAAREVVRHAMYRPPATLDQTIDPVLLTRVDPILDRFHLPRAQARQMKPWMLGMTLTLLETQEAGYDPGYGVDVFLLGMAKGMKKPVVELESLAAQFMLFNSFTQAEQQIFLQETIDGIESGESKARLAALVEAWANADRGKLLGVLQEEVSQQSATFKRFYDKLLTERNLAMAEKISGYLQSGDQYFVAVGTFHLLGTGSIVELLGKRGFTIRAL